MCSVRLLPMAMLQPPLYLTVAHLLLLQLRMLVRPKHLSSQALVTITLSMTIPSDAYAQVEDLEEELIVRTRILRLVGLTMSACG